MDAARETRSSSGLSCASCQIVAPAEASGRPLAFVACTDDRVVFRVARACTTQEAAHALGLSRSGAAKAIEGAALRRILSEPDAQGDRFLIERQETRVCSSSPEAEAPLRRGEMLQAGAELAFHLARPEIPGPLSTRPADIIWQDRFLLAADKPAGILVHSDGTDSALAQNTLSARVQARLVHEAAAARQTPLVCQAVQRLDVDTTGLCLFSLCPEFQPALDAQVAGHTMRKRYLVLVRGTFPAKPVLIDKAIGRDRHDSRRMRVSASGKPACTRVRRLAVRDGCSLLLVELLSGRRHQIRVHLASMGYPVMGDALYGGARSSAGLMLHAWSETLTHPVTGERLELRTAWPARFGQPPRKLSSVLASAR